MEIKQNKRLYYLLKMKPEEAQALFSKETLKSISMINFISPTTNIYCGGTQCIAGCIDNENEKVE